MNAFLQVTTAAHSRDAASELARSAVASRLAACAQVIGPVESVYWHLGEMGDGEEWQVLLKTTAARYPALEAHLLAQHPWKNPEVTAIALEAGSASYLNWISASVSSVESVPEAEM